MVEAGRLEVRAKGYGPQDSAHPRPERSEKGPKSNYWQGPSFSKTPSSKVSKMKA